MVINNIDIFEDFRFSQRFTAIMDSVSRWWHHIDIGYIVNILEIITVSNWVTSLWRCRW